MTDTQDLISRARKVAEMLRTPTPGGFQYREKDAGAEMVETLAAEVAALRKRIEDAPVAYVGEVWGEGRAGAVRTTVPDDWIGQRVRIVREAE